MHPRQERRLSLGAEQRLGSSNVILCGGSAYKQCAAVPGEGCVRCTCAIGTPSTVPRWGSSSTVWSDRENQNLMGQPRVP